MNSRSAFAVAAMVALGSPIGCVAATQDQHETPATKLDAGPTHISVTTPPATLGALETGEVDPQGDRIGVICATCHGMLTEAIKMPVTAADTAGPHVGLKFEHGVQPCANCHLPEHVNELRLADGRVIAPVQ